MSNRGSKLRDLIEAASKDRVRVREIVLSIKQKDGSTTERAFRLAQPRGVDVNNALHAAYAEQGDDFIWAEAGAGRERHSI